MNVHRGMCHWSIPPENKKENSSKVHHVINDMDVKFIIPNLAYLSHLTFLVSILRFMAIPGNMFTTENNLFGV